MSTRLLRRIQTLTVLTKHVSAAKDHLYTTPCFSSSADMLRLLSNSTILNTHQRHTSLQRKGDDTLIECNYPDRVQKTPMLHDSCSTSHVVLVSQINVSHVIVVSGPDRCQDGSPPMCLEMTGKLLL